MQYSDPIITLVCIQHIILNRKYMLSVWSHTSLTLSPLFQFLAQPAVITCMLLPSARYLKMNPTQVKYWIMYLTKAGVFLCHVFV